MKNYLLFLTLLMVVGALSLAASQEYAGAAALGATAGALAVLFVFSGQKSRDTSQFYLVEAKLAIEEAANVIQDSSYDRAKWVLAARMIRRAIMLSESITENDHKLAFELWVDVYRNKFHELLLSDSGYELSSRFFAGAETWEEALQKQRDSGGRLIYIPEVILRNIYEFAKYPDDYVDSIKRYSAFSEEDLSKVEITMEALAGYIRKMRDPEFIKRRVKAQLRQGEES